MSEQYTKEEVDNFLVNITAVCEEYRIYIEDGFELFGGKLGDLPIRLSDDVEWSNGFGYRAKQLFNVKMDEGE